ncbi:MAG: DUF4369 domain-containing protein, partial [Aestuariibaculum sp.]
MKKIVFLFLVVLISSCEKKQHDLVVKGSIKGLKKGVVYLKKLNDTVLFTIDSVVVNGQPNFELYSEIESPEIFYLDLDKNSKEENRILFFADKGITEISTTLKNFTVDAKINGSEQQKLLERYREMIGRFNGQNLDLIKETLNAQKADDKTKLDSIDAMYN